jgi:hypothetical protein
MKYVIIYLSVILSFEACAQGVGEISFNDFQQLLVDDQISMADASSIHKNFSTLRTSLSPLGNPSSNACTSDIIGSSCEFDFNGLTFSYVDVGSGLELAKMELTNENHFLKKGNTTYRVGANISSLSNLSNTAYQARGEINYKGETIYGVRIQINSSSSYLVFEYNPLNQTITTIRFIAVVT